MANLLVIRVCEKNQVPVATGLVTAVESEIHKKYEVYGSRSVAEAEHLLQALNFQAVLIITLGEKNQGNLPHHLQLFTETGGTVILTSRCFKPCLDPYLRPTTHCSKLDTNFILGGHRIDKSTCHYALNPNFENLFGPSVFAALAKEIRTDTQTIDVVDSAKIYKSVRDGSSNCAAAFFKRGEGFVGYLGDTEEGPVDQTLLLAMLDHALKPSPPSPTFLKCEP